MALIIILILIIIWSVLTIDTSLKKIKSSKNDPVQMCATCLTKSSNSEKFCVNCGGELITVENSNNLKTDVYKKKVSDSTNSNYPFLSVSKAILRTIGVLCIILCFAIGIRSGENISGIIGINNDIGIVLGVLFGLITGAISGFGFFILAEIIELFVKMGQNVENMAKNVQKLTKREED